MTELVFILDRSGSMAGMERDTIGGFNAMLRKQQASPDEVLVSTILFDNESTVLHDRIPLHRVPLMTAQDYQVGGCTALLDAVGGAIRHISTVHRYARPEDRPRRTLFVITTDGLENVSRRYTYEKVKEMIQRQKAEHDWEFLFLAANIDAAAEAARFGIAPDRAVDYHCDAKGTEASFCAISKAVFAARCDAPLGTGWREDLDADFRSR